MKLVRRPLLLCLLLGPAGCIQLSYQKHWIDEPPPAAVVDSLQVGRDDLGSCLSRLGAPHYVWEYDGDGMALGWVYSDDSAWGLGASYSFSDYAGVSFDFDSGNLQLPGVVLWFGADLRLLRWQRGKLAALTSTLRRRSAPVDGPVRER